MTHDTKKHQLQSEQSKNEHEGKREAISRKALLYLRLDSARGSRSWLSKSEGVRERASARESTKSARVVYRSKVGRWANCDRRILSFKALHWLSRVLQL